MAISQAERRVRRQQIATAYCAGEPATTISARFGMTIGSVYNSVREFHGPVTNRHWSVDRPRKSPSEYALLDWRQTDTVLAAESRLSKSRVQQLRRILGKPPAELHGHPRRVVMLHRWIQANADSLSDVTLNELKARSGTTLSRPFIANVMRDYGFDPNPASMKNRAKEFLTRGNWSEHVTAQPSGCWHWNHAKNKITGYGLAAHAYAHRLCYEIFNGPIPDGMLVLHQCDNPPCVNPAHLFLGTHTDNARDREAKGRHKGRLSREQELAVVSRAAAGESIESLSKEYDRSVATIRNIIIRGKLKRAAVA